MFSAFILTCVLGFAGNQECNVSYTEMPEYVQTQDECDSTLDQMHTFVIARVEMEHPEVVVYRKEHGCYGGPLSGAEVARDEHAKLLEAGINASLTEIP